MFFFSRDVFIHIHQGCFDDIWGIILWMCSRHIFVESFLGGDYFVKHHTRYIRAASCLCPNKVFVNEESHELWYIPNKLKFRAYKGIKWDTEYFMWIKEWHMVWKQ